MTASPHSRVLCRDCQTVWEAIAEPVAVGAAPSRDDGTEGARAPGACPSCRRNRLLAHDEITTLEIAHIDCDAFYASVEKRDRPELRDKPLLVGSPSGRGVVTTACYVARRYGPRSAMPMFKALELCPDAVVVRPDMEKYRAVSQAIRSIFLDETDVIEPLSLDEAYLDLSAEVRHAGTECAAQCLARIARRVEAEVGITVSIGLSYNKFLAKLASDLDKPRGFSVIGRGEAKEFLAALPVARIHGVGAATERRMARQGLTHIAQLQAMPREQLVALFGRFGHRLAAYVNGEDPRDVTPARAVKSVSAETTFDQDLRTLDDLSDRLCALSDRVAGRLATKRVAGQTVVLKLKTSDFQVLTRNKKLRRPATDARTIYETGRALLAGEVDGRAYRLIGIGVADLEPITKAGQQDLFDA